MGSATPVSIRKMIVNEKLGGKTLRMISIDHSLSYSTTCNIWRLYKEKGIDNLEPQYQNCGPQTIKSSYRIYRCSLWLKRKHVNWGAPIIKTILEDRYPSEEFPTIRMMQLWFRKANLNKPKAYRKEPKVETVESPHDCWQLDAKENIKLLDGSKACYLTSVDVKSGSVLGTSVFPQRKNQSS